MRFKLTIFFVVFCIAYAIANQSNIVKPRVIGTYEPNKGVYGFIVSVQVAGQHVCGGTIYGTRTVVTAASCVRDVENPVDRITIYAGESQLKAANSDTKRIFTVDKVIIHEGEPNNITNNIALLHTREDMKTTHIRSIEFPEEDIPEGTDTYTCGWGANSLGGKPVSETLTCTQSETVSIAECKIGDSSNICARTYDPNEGPCEKDAGGPLFKASDDSFLGITTPDVSCGLNVGDIYMSAAAYKDWIMNNAAGSINLNQSILWISIFVILQFI